VAVGFHEQRRSATAPSGIASPSGCVAAPGAGGAFPPGPQSGPCCAGSPARGADGLSRGRRLGRTPPIDLRRNEGSLAGVTLPSPATPSGSGGDQITQGHLPWVVSLLVLAAADPFRRVWTWPAGSRVVSDAWRVLIPGNEVRNDPGTGNRSTRQNGSVSPSRSGVGGIAARRPAGEEVQDGRLPTMCRPGSCRHRSSRSGRPSTTWNTCPPGIAACKRPGSLCPATLRAWAAGSGM
jgi:hypothetical protein